MAAYYFIRCLYCAKNIEGGGKRRTRMCSILVWPCVSMKCRILVWPCVSMKIFIMDIKRREKGNTSDNININYHNEWGTQICWVLTLCQTAQRIFLLHLIWPKTLWGGHYYPNLWRKNLKLRLLNKLSSLLKDALMSSGQDPNHTRPRTFYSPQGAV